MDLSTYLLSGSDILMEGALGERLKREYNLTIDGIVAMASLIFDEKGKVALKTLWREYIDISRKYGLPFLATTPTRRANRERVQLAGYDKSVILQNVEFLRQIKESVDVRMYIGGLMGCKGDAYTGEGSLEIDEAKEFHSWQANIFKEAKVDFLYAGIMPVLTEAAGMAMAMSETNIPYIISFTIRRDGRLIDGNSIDYVIHFIDENVMNKPLCYMTNCVHPDIVYEALSHTFNQTKAVQTRFVGIQANTSALSYNELDGATDLKSSSPEDLAEAVMKLKTKYHFNIFGGCCGTDGRHMEEIAKRLKKKIHT